MESILVLLFLVICEEKNIHPILKKMLQENVREINFISIYFFDSMPWKTQIGISMSEKVSFHHYIINVLDYKRNDPRCIPYS